MGVDWESLVKETQPRRIVSSNRNSAESRWQCRAIFQRIGVSAKYAGEDMMNKLAKKYRKDDHTDFFLNSVAFMHTALARNRLLHDLNNELLPTMDDFLYRNNNVNNADDVEYDVELLKPCTSLYEEAKCLLQQAV